MKDLPRSWKEFGLTGNDEAAELMARDMIIHTIEEGIEEFSHNKYAPTLLLSALAEVHSNAKMFGGFETSSFKKKWNQINDVGNIICKERYS